jgi:hypothetical protein
MGALICIDEVLSDETLVDAFHEDRQGPAPLRIVQADAVVAASTAPNGASLWNPLICDRFLNAAESSWNFLNTALATTVGLPSTH